MAEIANFVSIRLSAFSDPPGGGNDPFVLASSDPSNYFRISIDDDDTTLEGDTNSNETPNDANQIATISTLDGTVLGSDASYVEWTATYTGTNGQVITVWRIEIEDPISGVGRVFFAMSEVPEVGIVFSTNDKDQGANGLDPADIPMGIPCFTPGAGIATPLGTKAVEDLAVGDLVITKHHGIKPVRWIGQKHISGARLYALPQLQPILIKKHALGAGYPSRDLIVSPQHRMVFDNRFARTHFGVDACLVPAQSLLVLPGVTRLTVSSVTYIHVMFDQHEVIFANDSATESFHPGEMIMNAMDEAVRAEILEIFPQLDTAPVEQAYGAPVLPVLTGQESAVLMQGILA